MKKITLKKNTMPIDLKDRHHVEIIVKPAKRLLAELIKAEEKELSSLITSRKTSISSR